MWTEIGLGAVTISSRGRGGSSGRRPVRWLTRDCPRFCSAAPPAAQSPCAALPTCRTRLLRLPPSWRHDVVRHRYHCRVPPGEAPDATDGAIPRVLLLIKGLGLGGAERLLVDVMATRDRQRFDYEVAYVLAGQDALAPAMKATGVPVHDLGGSASADLRWTVALRSLLVERRFDVLHAHLPYTAAFGRLVALTL